MLAFVVDFFDKFLNLIKFAIDINVELNVNFKRKNKKKQFFFISVIY